MENTLKGFLIDIDGVLYVERQAIRGAVEAIQYLQKNKLPFLLVTNTTRRSRFSLLNNLQRLGFKIDIGQILSAPHAAAQWLKENGVKSISLFARGDTYREFKAFRITTNKPEYVVIGDIGEDLSYATLNQAFRLIMGGSKMLALQKNRFWQRNTGLAIDSGAIVAALEYATRQEAMVIGKPSREFFLQGLKVLNLPPENVAMIGDDMEADILGGAGAGLYTIAVQTGKFSACTREADSELPHQLLASIAELPGWLESRVADRQSETGR